MNRRKIIFVTNQFKTGGVESVFMNISDTVSQRIILFPVHNSTDPYLINRIPKNVEIVSNNFKLPRNLFGLAKTIIMAFKYRNIMNTKNAIVINFSDTLTTLLVSFILNPKNYYSWIHCNPEALLKPKTNFIYWRLLKKCKKIIFISNSQRNLFFNLDISSNINEKKGIVCTNFLNSTDIDSKKKIKVKLNYEYFFTAARLDLRSKDFFTLIKGYSLLPTKVKDKYKLIIAGNGPDKDRIINFIHNLNENKNVFLIGNQINPYKYMKNAKLYIHASISEGFSMAILEALSCGCTVIASDCKVGPKEILQGERYGYLFKPQNSLMLKEKILAALNKGIEPSKAEKRAETICNIGRKKVKEFLENGV
ncbi:glycosyltransferase [Limosilactobacillus reuteri subsp. suis]|uniref:glycosyltransferase n=1 Tax=Limosilactobacillus reuteri TaxID=1598 RepID=UPI00399178A7